MRATLVAGPPLGGKSTYVADRRQEGDVVICRDSLYQAITGRPEHDHDDGAAAIVLEAFSAMLRTIAEGRSRARHAWVISGSPEGQERLRIAGQLEADVVLVTAGDEELRRRARAERPADWLHYVDVWLSRFSPCGLDRIVRTG